MAYSTHKFRNSKRCIETNRSLMIENGIKPKGKFVNEKDFYKGTYFEEISFWQITTEIFAFLTIMAIKKKINQNRQRKKAIKLIQNHLENIWRK